MRAFLRSGERIVNNAVHVAVEDVARLRNRQAQMRLMAIATGTA